MTAEDTLGRLLEALQFAELIVLAEGARGDGHRTRAVRRCRRRHQIWSAMVVSCRVKVRQPATTTTTVTSNEKPTTLSEAL